MKFHFTFLTFLLFFSTFGQQNNYTIFDGKGACEPSVFINPTNLSNIVSGAVLNHVSNTQNTGKNWQNQILSSSLGVWGDPCIIADSLGNFYYFHLSKIDSGSFIDRLVCQKSSDGGKTWSDGTAIGLNGTKAQDKEWAVICPKTNNIYLTWTQFDKYKSTQPNDSSIIRFAKSTDLGESFSEPKRISFYSGNCLDNSLTVEGAVPAVDSEGNIFVAWAGPKGLVFNRSLDGGETWLPKETLIDEMPGGWRFDIPGIMRCNGFPVTGVDLAKNSPFKNRLYVMWSDQRNGENDTDIFLKYSDDKGETWSDLIRVNNDKKGNQQFFPWMSVDPATGYIYIVFYDRRNHKDHKTDVYLAVSKNGGKSFKNHQISDEPFTPNPKVFFGDYNNINALNGFVTPIWTHLNDTVISVKSTNINPYAIKTAHWLKPALKGEKPYNKNFKVFKNERLSCWISNYEDDKTLAVLFNQRLTKKGKLKVKFYPKSLGLTKGYYWLNLKYDSDKDTLQFPIIIDPRR
jgi:hypothetical protein